LGFGERQKSRRWRSGDIKTEVGSAADDLIRAARRKEAEQQLTVILVSMIVNMPRCPCDQRLSDTTMIIAIIVRASEKKHLNL
jgi:uncharacterized protein YijF (DUF1287 family)